jgi:hypothetical protein
VSTQNQTSIQASKQEQQPKRSNGTKAPVPHLNPRNHVSATDSRLITLSKTEIGNLTDEEILSRFLKGFFNGYIFLPEKGIISLFRLFGRKMVPVGFTGTF